MTDGLMTDGVMTDGVMTDGVMTGNRDKSRTKVGGARARPGDRFINMGLGQGQELAHGRYVKKVVRATWP